MKKCPGWFGDPPSLIYMGAFYVGLKWLGFDADHLYQVLYLHLPACFPVMYRDDFAP